MRISQVGLSIALLATVTALAAAQPTSASSPANRGMPSAVKAPDYGTASLTHVRVSAMEFSPLNTNLSGDWYPGPGRTRYPSLYLGSWEGPFHLPGGALLKRVELDYCDANASGHHVQLNVLECDNQGQGCSPIGAQLVSTSNGCAFVADDTLNYRVDAYHHLYSLEVDFTADDGTVALASVILSYQLDVSPAPATASFADVPTSDPAFQYVEALVSSGITAGCGSGNYCPDAPLTRRQMAVFLSKALGLHWAGF